MKESAVNVMNRSTRGAQRGDGSSGGGESEGLRFRLHPRRKKAATTCSSCCFSASCRPLYITGSRPITPELFVQKIYQRCDGACVQNVCLCDLMHAGKVYLYQLQSRLSYFTDEVVFSENIQVRTGAGCCFSSSCF